MQIGLRQEGCGGGPRLIPLPRLAGFAENAKSGAERKYSTPPESFRAQHNKPYSTLPESGRTGIIRPQCNHWTVVLSGFVTHHRPAGCWNTLQAAAFQHFQFHFIPFCRENQGILAPVPYIHPRKIRPPLSTQSVCFSGPLQWEVRLRFTSLRK